MIRIRRGPEPASLVTARNRRLSAAVHAYNQHGHGSKELTDKLVGYKLRTVKKRLFLAQHKKCAWCEMRAQYSSSAVEHYRPKDGAHRHDRGERPRIDHGHYWWLAWTWENLLFSCTRCNDQGHNANFFPLAPGSSPLALPRRPHRGRRAPTFFDTSDEQPMLLDPAVDDPLDHIVWKPLQRAFARRYWKWSPSGLTARGTQTIKTLKLEEIADLVEDHLRIAVLPSLEEIEGHLIAGRRRAATGRWQALLADTVAPSSPFAAATWWALEEWMPATKRTQSGLSAPVRPKAV